MKTRFRIRLRAKETRLTVPNTFTYSLKGFKLECKNYNEQKKVDDIKVNAEFSSLQVSDENKPVISLIKDIPFQLSLTLGKESESKIVLKRPQLIFIPRDVNRLQLYWGKIITFVTNYMKVQSDSPMKITIEIIGGLLLFEDNQGKSSLALEYSTEGQIVTQSVQKEKEIKTQLKSLRLSFSEITIRSTQKYVLEKTQLDFSLQQTAEYNQYKENVKIGIKTSPIIMNIGAYEYFILVHIFKQLNNDIKYYFFNEQQPISKHQCSVYVPFNAEMKPFVLQPNVAPSIRSYKITVPKISLIVSTDMKCMKLDVNDFEINGKTGTLTTAFSFEVDYFNADKQLFEPLIDETALRCAWIGTSTRIFFEKCVNVNVSPHTVIAFCSLMNVINSCGSKVNDIAEIINPLEKEQPPILNPFSLINNSGSDLKVVIGNKKLIARKQETIHLPEGSKIILKMEGYNDISFIICGLKQIIELTNSQTNKRCGYLIIQRSSLRELIISSFISVKNETNTPVVCYISTKNVKNLSVFKLEPNGINYLEPVFSRMHFSLAVAPIGYPPPQPNPLFNGNIPTDTPKQLEEVPITKLFGSAPVDILMITPKYGIPTLDSDGKYIRTVNFVIQHPYIFESHIPASIHLTLKNKERKEKVLLIPPFSKVTYSHNDEKLTGIIMIENDVMEHYYMEKSIFMLKSEEFFLLPANIRSRRIYFNSPIQPYIITMRCEEKENFPTIVHFEVPAFIQNQSLTPLIFNGISLPTDGSIVPLTKLYDNQYQEKTLGLLHLKSDDSMKYEDVKLPDEDNGILTIGNQTNPIDIIYNKSKEKKTEKDLIIIKQRYVIHNITEYRIKFYCQQYPNGTTSLPNSYVPCNISGKLEMSVEMEIENELFMSEHFEIVKELNCQIYLTSKSERYSILSLDVSINQLETIITLDGIKEYSFCLQNFTPIPITLEQVGTIHTYTIQPNQSLPFAWTDPSKKHQLIIHDKNKAVINPMISSEEKQLIFYNEKKKRKEIVYSSYSLSKSTTFINFTSQSMNSNIKELNVIPLFDFSIMIPSFGASILINDIEFIHLTLFNTKLLLVQTYLHTNVEFTIDYLQIDNQDVTLFKSKPVILSPSPSEWINDEKQNYMHFGAQLLRIGKEELSSQSLSIVKMTFALQVTEIQMDPTFLARAIEVFSIYKTVFNNMSRAGYTHTVESQKLYLKIEEFICNSISFHLTINPSQGDPPPLSESATTLHWLTQMNAIKNVPIVIRKLRSLPTEMEFWKFMKILLDYFSNEIDFPTIKKQWASGIIGFNNIRLSYEQVDYHEFERFQIPGKLFKDVEKKIPKELKEAYSSSFRRGFSQGVDSLKTGVTSGVKGIWTTPSTMYQMAKEKSSYLAPIGFVGGIVAGVTGVVVKPIDGVVGLVQNVGMGISGDMCGSIAEERIRFPWYVEGGPYNEKDAIGWSLMMECDDGKYSNKKYINSCFKRKRDKSIESIIIADTHLLVVTKNYGEPCVLCVSTEYNNFKGIFSDTLSMTLYYDNNGLSKYEMKEWSVSEYNILRKIIENAEIKTKVRKQSWFLNKKLI